ncbi:MAG: ammonium transporter [Magnetococcales bacterium]|nr:ammonium transporter [Magnetococcales bacterium]
MTIFRNGGVALSSALGGLALAWPGAAQAEELNQAANAWMMTSTALVLFMNIPALALFYGGLVRAKNVLSVMMHCFAITCVISVLWLIYGYSVAFGDGGTQQALWGGLGKAFHAGVGVEAVKSGISETVYSMFQLTFAIITPALVAGGFAERIRFSAVLIFTVVWFTLVYLPLCHWVWGGGWLQTMGFNDFAGGSVVHINAGVAALTAAVMMGRRKGFPHTAFLPHNLTFTYIGAAMLWVGWFGFNGGSAVAANGNAGMAIMATHMAAAGGSLTWMLMEWVRHGKPSVLGIVTGMVAGLGTVTPASGFIGPLGGLIIGLMAGVLCYWATHIIKRKLFIDDSLDVFPVHGVGGIFGTLLTGVFAAPALGGLGYAEGVTMASQVGVQAIGAVTTIGVSVAGSWVAFKAADLLTGLRVNLEQETEGLDLVLHDERGYNLEY